MDLYIAQLIEENKHKPAMLSTKLFLLSKTDEELLLGLNKHLYEKLDHLSETDSGAGTEFRELYDFALRISSISNRGKLLVPHAFHAIRHKHQLTTEYAQQIHKSTCEVTHPKGLIVRAYVSLLLGSTVDVYTCLLKACSADKHVGNRLLHLLSVDQVKMLRECLIEGRKNGQLHCTCNKRVERGEENKKVERGEENFGYVESVEYLPDVISDSKLYPDIRAVLNKQTDNRLAREGTTIEQMNTCFTFDGPEYNTQESYSEILGPEMFGQCSTDITTFSLHVCDLHYVISELDDVPSNAKC